MKPPAFWRLALLFISLPLLEMLGLWICSGIFGLPLTIIGVFGTGILGAALARRQGLRCWNDFNRQLDLGQTPTLPIMHGLLILLAGIFLVVPGPATDLVGILLLIPPIRAMFISYLILRFEHYRAQNRYRSDSAPSEPPTPPDIIDI